MPTKENGQAYSNNSSTFLTNCLSMFDHFVGLALKGLNSIIGKTTTQVPCYINQNKYRGYNFKIEYGNDNLRVVLLTL